MGNKYGIPFNFYGQNTSSKVDKHDDVKNIYTSSSSSSSSSSWSDEEEYSAEEDYSAEELIDSNFNINQNHKSSEKMKKRNDSEENDAYPILNPENVGLCVIVNMAEFEKNVEKREELKHLLPEKSLEDRRGSLMDVKNLKDTFIHLKFTVVEIHNVFHDHLEPKVQSVIRGNFKPSVHSVLVLCILSHGDKGVVYASNSIPVKIQSIQTIISGPTPMEDLLANIPKVIIVQACQGMEPLCVELKPDSKEGKKMFSKYNQLQLDGGPVDLGGSELRFDSPQFTAKYADVLMCSAIIEGFTAVRSQRWGSIYIQEFCKCLNQYYKKDHLLDIVTRVHNNLNSKLMHVRVHAQDWWNCMEHLGCMCTYMTPEVKHTLRKKLYLTHVAFSLPPH